MKKQGKYAILVLVLAALLVGVMRVLAANVSLEMGPPAEVIPTANKTVEISDPPVLAAGDELEAFVDGVLAAQLQAYHLAGATVAVVRGEEILLAKGYGYADITNGVPVDAATTLFRIGSITKLFTWTGVMQLAEEGALDLDADINAYLDFEIPATYPAPITLKQLMTHTAGFEEMGFGLFATGPQAMVSNETWLKARIPARVCEPGKVSAYSNYGSALAGYILERQAGMAYEDYVDGRILKPIGMENSTATQPLPDDLAGNMSQGYRYVGSNFAEGDFELVNGAPAGAISASAVDMAHFMLAHLNGGTYGDGRILSEATTATMHSRLWGADPRLNGWAYGFYEMNQNGRRVIGHGGDTRLFHSLLALLPDEKVGLFVSYNTETDSMAPQKLLEAFMDRYYPLITDALPQTPADTLVHAAQVAGSYRVNRAVYSRAGKIDSLFQPIFIQAGVDGTLTVPSPVGMMQFVEVAPYYYQQVGGEDKAVFWVDEVGQVSYTFINSFPMMAAERLPWYQSAILHLGLIVICLVVCLSVLVVAPIGYFVAREQGKRLDQPGLARMARWVLGMASVLCLAFVALYALSLQDPMVRLTGQRGLLDALSWVALLVVLCAVAAIGLNIQAWRKKYWRLVGRLHYTAVTVGMVIFAVLLVAYNQVGWQW